MEQCVFTAPKVISMYTCETLTLKFSNLIEYKMLDFELARNQRCPDLKSVIVRTYCMEQCAARVLERKPFEGTTLFVPILWSFKFEILK